MWYKFVVKKVCRLGSVLFVALLMSTCVEPFEEGIESFESLLIIDATLTNEMKQHEVILSRTYRFNEEQEFETGAQVIIVEDQSTQYNFDEVAPGRYVASSGFMAVAGREYQLVVRTSNNNEYVSDVRSLTPVAEIGDVYAERVTNDENGEGISVFVDTEDPTGNAKFFRYEYEETNKIIAPDWIPLDIVVVSENPPTFDFVDRPVESRVCYATNASADIILASTVDFSENKVNRFPVRFLAVDNYLTQNRYSILVKQLVQSPEAYSFYETLQEFSDFENLFSQTQPGFIAGNITAVTNTEEKVVGFFDVSSVSSKRIFFEHVDFFPEEPLPPFVDECDVTAPMLSFFGFSPLIDALSTNLFVFEGFNEDPLEGEGIYNIVPKVCGDCRELGSSEIPDFWEE